jgi:Uncharacterized protein conserved in bacteria
MNMMKKAHIHESHPDIIKRLRRSDGQIRGIIGMIEANRPCPDIAQQLHAVEKAIRQAKKLLIQDHLNQCLEDLLGPLETEQRRSTDEFRDIVKYL